MPTTHKFRPGPKSALTAALLGACGLLSDCRPGPDDPFGPRDSYVLLAPVAEAGAKRPSGAPLVERRDGTEPEVAPLVKALMSGFGAEMLRTVYMAKQFVRASQADGTPRSARARKIASDAVIFVVGHDRDDEPGRGLRLQGDWWGDPVERPDSLWIGLPRGLREDNALPQTVTARLAKYLALLAASGGTLEPSGRPPGPLVDGYRMAMEVISREWHEGAGLAGRIDANAGTESQRLLFAGVRENAFVRAGADTIRPANEMLRDPGVAATVFYRLAQSRKLALRVAPAAFYQPFAGEEIPPGMSPAAVLGSFRNLQAKLLVTWAGAVARGHGPGDIADLIALYSQAFPEEKLEAIRIFLVTTFGATAKAGGVSMKAADARAALAELTALTAEVAAGKRGLRAALETPAGP